jgi:hypothetical protein
MDDSESQDDNIYTETLCNPSASLTLHDKITWRGVTLDMVVVVGGGTTLEVAEVGNLLISALLAHEEVNPGPGATRVAEHKFNDPTAWVLRV